MESLFCFFEYVFAVIKILVRVEVGAAIFRADFGGLRIILLCCCSVLVIFLFCLFTILEVIPSKKTERKQGAKKHGYCTAPISVF
ncbi:MAG TPA: hypothetical protein DDX91_03020 [Ruminococcaceae bacterium]|nr:hypothetical protein [Oscillospiraceae bacterium]